MEKKFAISQFADDKDLFNSSCTETNKALSYVEKFGKVSGLGLNFSKTEGLTLGPDNFSRETMETFHGKQMSL